jgi:hypothetical protein
VCVRVCVCVCVCVCVLCSASEPDASADSDADGAVGEWCVHGDGCEECVNVLGVSFFCFHNGF